MDATNESVWAAGRRPLRLDDTNEGDSCLVTPQMWGKATSGAVAG
jgi:hypothetical protein